VDTSETYIKMCEKAVIIQYDKEEIGYFPGDFFLGPERKVMTVGFDILNIEHLIRKGLPFIKVAAISPSPVLSLDNNYPHEVKLNIADLTVKVLCGSPYLVWLPRQDQLQEMVILPRDFIGNRPIVLTNKLIEWSEIYHHGIYTWGESFEQLWLAFVMSEKYNKNWIGETWKKIIYDRDGNPHEPGCPAVADDETDYEYLHDAGICCCNKLRKEKENERTS